MSREERTEDLAPPLAQQLRAKRSEMMAVELETVALRLFHERGFAQVTVAAIAGEASISARTFYRYFLAKEDVLQLQIDRRCAAIRKALWARPTDEAPLQSLRSGIVEAIATEDLDRTRRWTEVIAATPEVVMGVLGGIVLKTQRAIAEFMAARLELPSDALHPTMIAAAATGVIQAAQTQWLQIGRESCRER